MMDKNLVMRPQILGIIPARFGSSRFPGKPLVEINGRPMIEHVYDRAKRAKYLDSLLVATDDERIAKAVGDFGGRAVMTRDDHPSGTDRLAEVAAANPHAFYVNIQGDEPLIDPAAIDAAVLSIIKDDSVAMCTLAKRITDPRDLANSNVVKVVTDLSNNALYFSRCSIPCRRDDLSSLPLYLKHIGLYVYSHDLLLAYPRLTVGPHEMSERLEQLRALENGYRIRVVQTEYESVGVDTPEDLPEVARLLE